MSTEAKKAAKFQKGLQTDIWHALAGARILDCSTVVQRAYAIEQDKTELRNVQGVQKRTGNEKRKWEVRPTNGVINIS